MKYEKPEVEIIYFGEQNVFMTGSGGGPVSGNPCNSHTVDNGGTCSGYNGNNCDTFTFPSGNTCIWYKDNNCTIYAGQNYVSFPCDGFSCGNFG